MCEVVHELENIVSYYLKSCLLEVESKSLP